MSVVIVGGNERMECKYSEICKSYGCSAKIYTKENTSLKKKLGCPNLLILFTGTVSHKMMLSATDAAKRNNVPVIRVGSSSAASLRNVMHKHFSSL
ncbi:MAG: DUF2325 domain-containing protein [Clostridiales bacterium]|nr:DUF2325 domain-containing protein [Clostridiales bacterium]